MTLLLPLASAFLAVPYAAGRRDFLPDKGEGPPLLFLLFCAACAALSVIETLWPPAAIAVSTVETVFVPQL